MGQLIRDGVALAFADVGKGAPPILLVHEVAGDRSWFTPQIEHFRQSHRVVAVDLRGHGQSGQPESGYSTAGLADDLAWLCYELGVYRPVIVGHGLGGLIALDLAARYPDLPAAIVALDAPLLPPPETQVFLLSLAQGLRSPDYEEILCQAHRSLCQPSATHRCSGRVPEGLSPTSREALAAACENAVAWDGALAVASCRVPVLYVDGGSHATDLDRLRKLCPCLTLDGLDGAGHFLQLEAPDQLNAVIDRFLALLPGETRSA